MTDRRVPSGSGPQEEHAARMARDALVVEYLKSLPAGNPAIVRYALDLRDYGLGTIIKMRRSGGLRGKLRELVPLAYLPPVPQGWDFPPLDTIIFFAVQGGIDKFMEVEVLGGGWKPERGATIFTHFVNKSCRRYIDEYRKAYAIAEKFNGEPAIELDVSMELDVIAWLQATSVDPERVIVDRDTIRRLLAEARHAKVAEIIYRLSVFKETYREIARGVNMSEGAVGAALSRFRADVSRDHGWDVQ